MSQTNTNTTLKKIFVTGATGFIGQAVISELKEAGYTILGMARSDAGEELLRKNGVEVLRGDVTDLESLRKGAAAADGVIHLAFNHDFSRYHESAVEDHAAIEAIGEVLKGTSKPFVVTSGTGIVNQEPGKPAVESDKAKSSSEVVRAHSEEAAKAVADTGVHVIIVRLPQVHDTRKAGLVTFLIKIAQEKKLVAYIGDGANSWPGVHVSDAARLYRLALEKNEKFAIYHCVDEEGVKFKDVAEALGKGLNLPVKSISKDEAPEYFGWMAGFASLDLLASSTITKQKLSWNPSGPSMLTDLQASTHYTQ